MLGWCWALIEPYWIYLGSFGIDEGPFLGTFLRAKNYLIFSAKKLGLERLLLGSCWLMLGSCRAFIRPYWCFLGPFIEPYWSYLGSFGSGEGLFLGNFLRAQRNWAWNGLCWAHVGPLLGHNYWGYLGPFIGLYWGFLGPELSLIGPILGRLEAMRGHFWALFFALKIT